MWAALSGFESLRYTAIDSPSLKDVRRSAESCQTFLAAPSQANFMLQHVAWSRGEASGEIENARQYVACMSRQMRHEISANGLS
jgi:hypothetical protein